MGYTEEKAKKILQLQQELNAATKDNAKAQADATAKTNTLNSRLAVYTQDEKDKAVAINNFSLVEKSLITAHTAETILSLADTENTEELLRIVTEMVNNAHETAEKTVHAAIHVTDLANLINKTKTKNKLISDLLVKDAKDALEDSTKAVTAVITALNDAMTAIGTVVHLHNSLEESSTQLQNLLLLLSEKKEGLKDALEDVRDKSAKKTQLAQDEKDKAQLASVEANKKLARETARLSAAKAALDAANAAVSLA